MKFSQALIAIAAATTMQVATSESAYAAGKISGKVKSESIHQSDWSGRNTLETKLRKEGWKVKQSGIGDGFYEIYGITPDGGEVKMHFHPVTMEKI